MLVATGLVDAADSLTLLCIILVIATYYVGDLLSDRSCFEPLASLPDSFPSLSLEQHIELRGVFWTGKGEIFQSVPPGYLLVFQETSHIVNFSTHAGVKLSYLFLALFKFAHQIC